MWVPRAVAGAGTGRCACCRAARAAKGTARRLVLPPGTYASVPGWVSRDYWLRVALPTAIARGRDVLRRHHVAPETLARVLAVHARHADDDTGRAVTVSVEHVLIEVGCSERTVQRARAAARELGIAVEVFRGRHMYLTEAMAAHAHGSKQRRFVSVYALGVPRWLARHLPQRLVPSPSTYPQLTDRPVEDGTPPIGAPSGSFLSRRSHGSSATSADGLAALEASTNQGGPDPGFGGKDRPRIGPDARSYPVDPRAETRPDQRRHHRGRPVGGPGAGPGRPGGPGTRRRPRQHPGAVRLAEDLRREIPVLRTTAIGRLVPALTRFAASPTTWSVAELVPLIWHVAHTKGWTINSSKIRNPAVWLAHLLQGIADTDPADLPTDHPEHPSAGADSSAVIRPDDPWAATLLPHPTSGPAAGHDHADDHEDGDGDGDGEGPTAGHDGLGWALRPDQPVPELPIRGIGRDHRHETLWDARSREHRHDHRWAEIARERRVQAAAAAERRGEHLCDHGAGGAGPTGRSPRCAHCRRSPEPTT